VPGKVIRVFLRDELHLSQNAAVRECGPSRSGPQGPANELQGSGLVV
jgi:hypothetical protein